MLKGTARGLRKRGRGALRTWLQHIDQTWGQKLIHLRILKKLSEKE